MFTCCALCIVLMDDFISRNFVIFLSSLSLSLFLFLSFCCHTNSWYWQNNLWSFFLRAARMLCIDSKTDPIEFTIKYIFYSPYDNKIMSKKCAHKCKIMSNTKKGNTKHTRSIDINAKNRWHTEHTTIKLKLIITIITKIYFPVYHTESFHILLIIICRRLNRGKKMYFVVYLHGSWEVTVCVLLYLRRSE